MDVPLYDVYLTGKLAPDVTPALASERLAPLFKATPATMLNLLTGKPHLLKRGVDKNTALKYRETVQRAGVEVAFKAQTIAPAEATAQPAAASVIATNNVVEAPTTPTAAAIATTPAAAGLSLAPAGADVLNDAERSHPIAVNIDTGHLSVAELGLLTDVKQADVQAIVPTVDHLSLAATGSNLLTAAERTTMPVAEPDVGDLSLAPAGATLETLQIIRPNVEVDISQLSLAPSDGELLTEEERRKTTATAPNTDHIKLA